MPVYCLALIDDMRAAQRVRNKAQAAAHSFPVFKAWNAVAGALRGSLRASREAAICGVARSGKGITLPASARLAVDRLATRSYRQSRPDSTLTRLDHDVWINRNGLL